MRSPIYRTFWGTHVDLARILEIGPAVFIDRMGSGGYFVGFSVQYQLRDGPVWYEFDTNVYDDENALGRPIRPDELKYASEEHRDWCKKHSVAWLQTRVDEIIAEWKKEAGK